MMRGVHLWVLLGASGGPEQLADRVVVAVDKEIVTETELYTEARVALAWREGEAAAFARLDEEMLTALREYVINQTLVALQAHRLASDDVSEGEIMHRMAQFKQRFKSGASYLGFLRRFGIVETQVQDILRRDLQNERYLAQRLRTRLSAERGAGVDDEAARGRYQNAVRSWLNELRQASEVRLLADDGELQLQGHDR